MSEKKTQFKSSWWIRRASYLVIGVVGLIAAGFGLIDEGQLDALTASPLLATVVGFIAAAFTPGIRLDCDGDGCGEGRCRRGAGYRAGGRRRPGADCYRRGVLDPADR